MKARSTPVVLSLALVLLAPISFRAADVAAASHAFVDPDDPAVAAIRRLGQRTIDHAGNALLLEVRQVLAATAPALAIGMLHLKNYKPPLAVPGGLTVTELRRTSLRVRNPANRPDAADLAALEKIQAQLEAGDPVSQILVQRVSLPDQPPEWRVYRPLVVLKQCMDCHGPADSLAPGVAETLQVFFPSDQAVNYKSGQWRGLLRVSIVEPARKP